MLKAFIWSHHQRELYSCQAEYYTESRRRVNGCKRKPSTEVTAGFAPCSSWYRGACVLDSRVVSSPWGPGCPKERGAPRCSFSGMPAIVALSFSLSLSHLSDFLSRCQSIWGQRAARAPACYLVSSRETTSSYAVSYAAFCALGIVRGRASK
jgi:hypothetical protein